MQPRCVPIVFCVDGALENDQGSLAYLAVDQTRRSRFGSWLRLHAWTDAKFTIAHIELAAIATALEEDARRLAGSSVLILIDDTVALSVLLKGGTAAGAPASTGWRTGSA